MTTETPPQDTQVVGPTLAQIVGALMALSGRLENERQWILQRANDMAKRVLEAEAELAEWRNSIATEKLNERITELEAENEKLRANQRTGQFIHGDGV